MDPAEETAYQRELLALHLRRLLAVEEQLAQLPDHVSLRMERDATMTSIRRIATLLGLDTGAPSPASIAAAIGMAEEYTQSLEQQRQLVTAYYREVERQSINADPSARVNLSMALQTARRRIEHIRQQLGALGAAPLPDASPSSASASRTATQPESTAAAHTRRAALLPIAEARLLIERAQSVAQINVGSSVDGVLRTTPTGTAWLIAPDLAITCWHVLQARGTRDPQIEEADLEIQVRSCLLSFDYEQTGQGIEYGVEQLEQAHRDDTGLDYVLLRLRDRADQPLAQRRYLRLDLGAPLTRLSEICIIQHPGSSAQQLASGFFEQPHPTSASRVQYSNRTEGGTSGAPVLNRTNWRAIALHHGTSKSGLGEGILLHAILADLRNARLALYDEIIRAQ